MVEVQLDNCGRHGNTCLNSLNLVFIQVDSLDLDKAIDDWWKLSKLVIVKVYIFDSPAGL
jgi:hypothetical protein